MCPDLHKCAQTCTNVSRHAQMWPDMHKCAQTCTNATLTLRPFLSTNSKWAQQHVEIQTRAQEFNLKLNFNYKPHQCSSFKVKRPVHKMGKYLLNYYTENWIAVDFAGMFCSSRFSSRTIKCQVNSSTLIHMVNSNRSSTEAKLNFHNFYTL